MEEQRIGMMYLNLAKRRALDLWDSLIHGDFLRSAAFPWLVVAALIAGPALGWYLHRLGRFSAMKREIKGEQQGGPSNAPKPGGMEPVVLTRTQTAGATGPEFLSATLLPGLGMDILQIRAGMPHGGEVALLSAPSVDEMAGGTLPPRMSLYDTRGAVELPWGGIMTGLVTPLGSTMQTSWHGRMIEVPTQMQGTGFVDGGLLPAHAVDSTETAKLPDGMQAKAVIADTDFNGHWPSRTDVQVQVQMQAHALDLTVTARNNGSQAEPMGMGWHPRFSLAGGDRAGVELRLPGGERLEMGDRGKGVPSSRIVAPDGLLAKMQTRSATLGAEPLSDTLVHLKPGVVDDGAVAEYRNPARGYGLRLVSLSPTSRALRVLAPAGADYVSLGLQTNYDDPFGKQWQAAADPAIAILQPGQTMVWRVRLEIFGLTAHGDTSSH